jgi:hypothetical protein
VASASGGIGIICPVLFDTRTFSPCSVKRKATSQGFLVKKIHKSFTKIKLKQKEKEI